MADLFKKLYVYHRGFPRIKWKKNILYRMHREKPRHMVWRKSMTQVVFQSHSKQSKRIDLKIKSTEKNKCLNEFIRENLHFLERAHLLRQCQPGGV